MEVILLTKVDKLGGLGDRVNVKAGYVRNYLLPKGKAVSATAENIAEFEVHRAELEKAQADLLSVAEVRAQKLNGMEVKLERIAGEEGKLFGSVNGADVAAAVTAAGVELSKQEVRLPKGLLKTLGEFEIDVHIHEKIDAKITVIIVAKKH